MEKRETFTSRVHLRLFSFQAGDGVVRFRRMTD